MKLISWNVNGIRAVERKGELQNLLVRHQPDILCLQETKARVEQLSPVLTLHPEYHQFYHSAEKKGYSGVSIWAKKSVVSDPDFKTGMDGFEDTEGRISRLDFGENNTVIGVYFPNGGKSPEAWKGKISFYKTFLQYVNMLRTEGRNVFWCGDVNCAHDEIDLARPKENMESIGFLPEERAWIDTVLSDGWVDVFRKKYPEKVVYSWWHVITRSREKNIGWRIDYFFLDAGVMPAVKDVEYLTDQMGSDHCPVLLILSS